MVNAQSKSGYRMIYITLLFLFAVLVLAAVFFDRISSLSMFGSLPAAKVKITIIVLAVICLIAAILVYTSDASRKYLQASQDYAQSQGWSFSRDDTQGLKTGAEALFFEDLFNLSNVRTVETGKKQIYLFDCTYRRRNAPARSNQSSRGLACMIVSDRFKSIMAPVLIYSRQWVIGMNDDRVEIKTMPFADQFAVFSKDPAAAKAIVNHALQSVIYELEGKSAFLPVQIAVGPGGAMVIAGVSTPSTEPSDIQEMISLIRRIESVMP